jgi:Mrp family chromosome partitioning ATPase
MGRILEALRRTEEPVLMPEVALAPAVPDAEAAEPPDEEMPFIEVGGPRRAAEPAVRLETAPPRSATLRVPPPLSVALQPCPAPTPRLAGELIAFHQPDHAVSQQYAALFAQITADTADGAAPVLLFTALAAGAGTTTAVLNLAIAGCRRHGRRVVVVDANGGRPAVAQRLGLTPSAVLREVLQGGVALEQAVQPTAVAGLHVLGAGTAMESPDAMRWILTWLRQRFDAVMVDAPAWGDSAELRAMVPAARAVYLVMDAAEAEQPQVRAVTRGVAQLGSRVGGMIVTS